MTSAEADALVSAVRAQFLRGAVKLGLAPEIAESALLKVATFGIWPSGLLLSSGQQAAIHNLAADWPRFEKWAGTWRGWAERGQRDDGSRFTWEKWAEFADVLGSDIAAQSGAAWEGSGVVAAGGAVVATGEQIANPALWPTWLKVGVGAVVALMVLNVVRR